MKYIEKKMDAKWKGSLQASLTNGQIDIFCKQIPTIKTGGGVGCRSLFLRLISNVTVETRSSTYIINKRSICMLKRLNHNFIYILHTCSHRHVIYKKGRRGGGGVS